MLVFLKRCHTGYWTCSSCPWWTPPRPCCHWTPANGPHHDESDLLGCWCFDNSATHVIDHVLLVHDGLLHVLVVTEHLLMVLIMTNLTSLDAGVLIMVRHMLLTMFFLVMMDSSMLVLSLSTWSWSSRWPSKYHVWHINQNPTIDRHLMVMFLGPKMHFYRILPMLWGGKCRLRCWGVANLWLTWNFFWDLLTHISFN